MRSTRRGGFPVPGLTAPESERTLGGNALELLSMTARSQNHYGARCGTCRFAIGRPDSSLLASRTEGSGDYRMNVHVHIILGALFVTVGAFASASAENLSREEQACKQLVLAFTKDGPSPSKQTLPNPPVLVVTEGDIVMLMFKRATPEPGGPGKTYDSFWFDAYRVAGDKIAEHWDPLTKPAVGARPAPAE
jgi:hypothetical protein